MNGIELPKGFQTAGIAVGIKKDSEKDLALLFSTVPAFVAATFTCNNVRAAPVQLSQKHLAYPIGSAIVVNSGIANACTGAQGERAALRMAQVTAGALDLVLEEVFVCSTGSIGPQLPLDKIERGIPKLVEQLSADNLAPAAKAIMTTDTKPKAAFRELKLGGKKIRLTGLAKGSGMIEPNMATMLAFIMTDAPVAREPLQEALKGAVDKSFNRISVDGDQSTNDSVICLANGMAGGGVLEPDSEGWPAFQAALEDLTRDLAMQIVRDGEGVSRTVNVRVEGALSHADADLASRAVANSLLNKTAWAGTRANWGRIMAALGYSGARLRAERVNIDYSELPVVRNGVAVNLDQDRLAEIVSGDHFDININLSLGAGRAVVYSCNCTEEYVRINI